MSYPHLTARSTSAMTHASPPRLSIAARRVGVMRALMRAVRVSVVETGRPGRRLGGSGAFRGCVCAMSAVILARLSDPRPSDIAIQVGGAQGQRAQQQCNRPHPSSPLILEAATIHGTSPGACGQGRVARLCWSLRPQHLVDARQACLVRDGGQGRALARCTGLSALRCGIKCG